MTLPHTYKPTALFRSFGLIINKKKKRERKKCKRSKEDRKEEGITERKLFGRMHILKAGIILVVSPHPASKELRIKIIELREMEDYSAGLGRVLRLRSLICLQSSQA